MIRIFKARPATSAKSEDAARVEAIIRESAAAAQAARDAAAIRYAPAAPGFQIETTTVTGRGHALLVCTLCAWYGSYVSGSCGGRVDLLNGDGLFRRADLSQLTESAAAHTCPPEVTAAQAEALRRRREEGTK